MFSEADNLFCSQRNMGSALVLNIPLRSLLQRSGTGQNCLQLCTTIVLFVTTDVSMRFYEGKYRGKNQNLEKSEKTNRVHYTNTMYLTAVC